MRAATRLGAAATLLALGAFGCPLQVRELPGCRLAGVTCDDANPCTEDSCDESTGECVFAAVPAGTDCGDGDACNGIERCSEQAACEAEPPLEVDDSDPCTRDACDPETGIVTHDPIEDCGKTFWDPVATTGAPSARARHTAVWTGDEMIIWGGRPAPGQVTNTGARYNPQTNSWSPVSATDAPTPRHSHSAVWTGNEMIIWGGFGESGYETSGARYNPTTNTWTAITNTDAPTGRTFHSTLWTGTEMIIWGGLNGTTALSDGARYAVGSDAWTSMPGGGPQARLKHAAVWTGSKMIIWGGTNTFDWLQNGAIYDRITDSWTEATSLTDPPFQRESASAVWTGDEMLIWGGWDGGNYLSDGYAYDVDANSWTPINAAAPPGRADHVSIWTGDQLAIWGGCNGQSCGNLLEDGGRYDTDDDTWHLIGSDPGLTPRIRATVVWTDTTLIVWGGEDASGSLGDGARATIP